MLSLMIYYAFHTKFAINPNLFVSLHTIHLKIDSFTKFDMLNDGRGGGGVGEGVCYGGQGGGGVDG